jgi:hypothetical protein
VGDFFISALFFANS